MEQALFAPGFFSLSIHLHTLSMSVHQEPYSSFSQLPTVLLCGCATPAPLTGIWLFSFLWLSRSVLQCIISNIPPLACVQLSVEVPQSGIVGSQIIYLYTDGF